MVGCSIHDFTRMLMKSLISSKIPSLRCFSSLEPRVLRKGDILRQARIYSSEDVVEYSKVSHDSNPVHFDSEAARSSGFDGPLVHGMLVAALFSRIISSHFPGAIYVSQRLHFRLPVYIGDKILGEVQAVDIRENKKRYVVKFSTRCVKNGEHLVLDGEAMSRVIVEDIERSFRPVEPILFTREGRGVRSGT